VECDKRPTIENLLSLPRIALRYKEVRLGMRYALLKQSEEEMKKRETAVEEREKLVQVCEEAVTDHIIISQKWS
jgi:hypothetical protein